MCNKLTFTTCDNICSLKSCSTMLPVLLHLSGDTDRATDFILDCRWFELWSLPMCHFPNSGSICLKTIRDNCKSAAKHLQTQSIMNNFRRYNHFQFLQLSMIDCNQL